MVWCVPCGSVFQVPGPPNGLRIRNECPHVCPQRGRYFSCSLRLWKLSQINPSSRPHFINQSIDSHRHQACPLCRALGVLAARVVPVIEKIIQKKVTSLVFEIIVEAHGAKVRRCERAHSEKEVLPPRPHPPTSHSCPDRRPAPLHRFLPVLSGSFCGLEVALNPDNGRVHMGFYSLRFHTAAAS